MKARDGVLIGAAAVLGLAAGALSGGAWLNGLGEAFMALGEGLRALSLSGGWKGALSWALYAALGLAPLLGLLPVRRKHGTADALWLIASAYAFFMLYALVNPFIMIDVTAPAWAWKGGNAFLALALASPLIMLLLAGVCLRLTGEDAREARLLRRVRRLLMVVEAIDVFLVAAALPGVVVTVQTGSAVWSETKTVLSGYGLGIIYSFQVLTKFRR